MLRGASGTGPAALAGETVLESAFRVARAQRLDGCSTQDVGASCSELVRGWSSTWATEGVLDPQWSRLANCRRRAACPRPAIYCSGQRSPDGPCLIIHSVLQVTGLAHAVRTRVPRAFTHFFVSLSHSIDSNWERDTRRRPGSGLGQLSRSPYLNLMSESPGSGCGPRWRQLGTRHRTPAGLRLAPVNSRQ